MLDTPSPPPIVRFSDFEVDLPAGRLSRRGKRLKLREQSFVVLAVLLERAGQVVTREQLFSHLWPDGVFVDYENNLNTAVARLRTALHDSADHPRFIETLPKHGYRFIAEIEHSIDGTDSEGRLVRIMVLPFANLSGDSGLEYLSEAVTDEMINGLASRSPAEVRVIARTTAMHYKDSDKDVDQICRELGADCLVEGSLHRASVQFAVNIQLIRGGDQTHLLAERIECGEHEIPRLLGDVARRIVETIGTAVEEGF